MPRGVVGALVAAGRGSVCATLCAAACAASLCAASPADAAERLITVAVDVRGLDDAAYRRFGIVDLERKVTLRLTQTGFAVVALGRGARIQLRFAVDAATPGLRIEARAKDAEARADRRVQRSNAKLEDFHLEAMHKAVEAARDVARLIAAARRRSDATPKPDTERPPPIETTATTRAPSAETEKRAAAERAPWRFDLGAAVLINVRPEVGGDDADGVDPLLRVDARWGRRRAGLALRASAGVSALISTEPLIHRIVEAHLQVGGSWRSRLAPTFHVEIAALIGGAFQHYDWGGGDEPAENGVSPLGNIAVELGWRVVERAELRLWLSPGLGAKRVRTIDGNTRTIYRRSPFRVEGGVGFMVLL